jgi:glutamyl-tRNA reductase
MMLLATGCNFHKTSVALRERLAFPEPAVPRALEGLCTRYGCEAVILSTCNRVELYLARLVAPAPLSADLVAEFLAEFHGISAEEVRPHLYEHLGPEAVRHLFRVAASLDSLIVGEGQIAGQVKRAYELAQQHAAVGPLLHDLFQHARVVAKRVRSETGIARGRVSVSSAAVDYVRQVFAHFADKTVLVIGAGKMGELTLRHLRELKPQRILVTNRSLDKAEAVARGCGGVAVPWTQLDDVLAQADIVLSTTGAPDVIVTAPHWQRILAKRTSGTVVILDIAVPRDFDPAIHDGEQTCLFNIDDLQRIKEHTLADRRKHVAPAEAIVEQEQQRFLKDWRKRHHAPVIALLNQEFETKRIPITQEAVAKVMALLNGHGAEEMRPAITTIIDGAMRLYQNRLLHGPISALAESGHDGRHTLLEALRKLFRLEG